MEFNEQKWLPSAKSLESWLELSQGEGVEELLEQSLLEPLENFLSRPSKHFRGQLVELGFEIVNRSTGENSGFQELIPQAVGVLESIHAASLVVDDIQDNSQERRGKPTLHREYGIAVALNSANWLYFWPLEIIQNWSVPAEVRMKCVGACHRALIKAHSGQALDVGTPISSIDQRRVKPTCLASLELKTGALTALALELGSVLAGGSELQVKRLYQIGLQFGVALQMFDDLGNIRLKNDPKRFEDLKGGRPSWVWAAASEFLPPDEYQGFIDVVKTLPEEIHLEKYFEKVNWPQKAKEQARKYLDEALEPLCAQGWDMGTIHKIKNLSETLKRAYE